MDNAFKICGRKQCKHKGARQPYSNFGKRHHTKDGYSENCNDCLREVSRIHQQKKKENLRSFKDMFI